jgi:acetyl-CoA synthetase
MSKNSNTDSLLNFTKYGDAQKLFTQERIWDLLDGNEFELNIANECVDRHRNLNNAAIRILNHGNIEENISFPSLADLSSKFANYLQSQNIRQGDKIAVMLEPSLDFYISVFGILKFGAVVVPLFPLFGTQALSERLIDSKSKLLITDEHGSNLFKESLTSTNINCSAINFDINFLLNSSSEFTINTKSEDAAVMLYTSGTSGHKPTAVLFPHRALQLLLSSALYGLGLRIGDNFFSPSSQAWGHGFWYGLVSPLALGITTSTLRGKFDPNLMLTALKKFNINNIAAAPTVFRLLRSSDAGNKIIGVNKISYSGESMDAKTIEYVIQKFGTTPCGMYGTTEVGVVLGNYPGASDFAVKPGSLGKPFPTLQIEIHNKENQLCPIGEIGEIKIFRRNQWISTRDLGFMDKEGYFFHAGRSDDVIISAGWTLSSVEIEDVLKQHPAIFNAGVIGVPDMVRGQIVKAFVTLNKKYEHTTVIELQEFIKNKLGRHEYPRIIEFISEIPLTPSGKINRNALRKITKNEY